MLCGDGPQHLFCRCCVIVVAVVVLVAVVVVVVILKPVQICCRSSCCHLVTASMLKAIPSRCEKESVQTLTHGRPHTVFAIESEVKGGMIAFSDCVMY